MLKRSIIPAAAVTVVLATVAQASLITSPAAPPAPQGDAPAPADMAVRRPDTAIKASAPQAEAPAAFQPGRPAPRVIDLPRAEATSRSYVALPSSEEAGTPPQAAKPMPRTAELTRPETERVAAGTATAPDRLRFGAEPAPERNASAQRPRAPEPVVGDARAQPRDGGRTAEVRTAKWSGGEGAVWKTGPDARAFTGTFGGCRFSGAVGPRGYTIDRAC
jgi:hypothetical protein